MAIFARQGHAGPSHCCRARCRGGRQQRAQQGRERGRSLSAGWHALGDVEVPAVAQQPGGVAPAPQGQQQQELVLLQQGPHRLGLGQRHPAVLVEVRREQDLAGQRGQGGQVAQVRLACGPGRKGDGGFRAGAGVALPDPRVPAGRAAQPPTPPPGSPPSQPTQPRLSWSCSQGLSSWARGGGTRQRRRESLWRGVGHCSPTLAPLLPHPLSTHRGQRAVLGTAPLGAGALTRPTPAVCTRRWA